MARLRAALPSACSGIATNRVQEGFNHEPDTDSQGGCKGDAKQRAEDD
jgi:hypothetical protein